MTAARAEELIAAWRPAAFSRLDVRGVSVFHGQQASVFRVSLQAVSGDSVALLGPNGAGKSTLLRVISTLDGASEGQVLAGTEQADVHRNRAVVRRHIGLVGHQPMLYPDLTGRENLALFAELHGRDAAVAEGWMACIGLEGAAGRPVRTWSRGMQQRLAVARALVHEPTLVLFDEVMTGLDRRSRAWIWDVVAALRAAGRIVLMVTHQFDHPAHVVNHAVVLRDGRVVASEPAAGDLGVIYERALAPRGVVAASSRAAAADAGSPDAGAAP